MGNLNNNSTSYVHSYEPNTNDLTMAMDYNDAGEPVIRVKSYIEGDITIEGDVNIPGSVEISNDIGNPIPVSGTITALQGTTPWTVDGTVNIGNEVSINDGGNSITVDVDGNVTVVQGTTPWTVDGTVNIGTMPEVEIKNDTGNPVPVSGTVSVNQPVAVTDNDGSLTVDGTVDIGNDVNVTQGTDPWTVTGNVNATIVGAPAAGSNKPFYLEVAQGLIAGYSFNHKFGAVPSMSGGTTGSVWDIDDTLYPWDALGTGSIVNVERNNTSDTGLDVTIQGLDENYDFAEETITITSANQTGSQLFTRVNRVFVSGGTNVADVDIEAGAAGGTTVARVTAGYGQSQMAVYTIPAGKTGYILHGVATGSSDTDASGSMRVRYFGTDTFRVGHAFEIQLRGGQYDYTFAVPIPVPEKTDIDVRMSMRSNNKRITAAFDVLLVDNS